MAIIGKLMGARPSMSAPRAAPRPDPVVSRPSLDFLTGGQPKQTLPADALDRDALIQDILSKIEVPSTPVFDPTGLQARLEQLEGREAPVFDPSALQQQISDLRQRPSRDDFMSIERQLQDLQNREIPQFDPSQLQAGIAGLQDRLTNIPQFDPSALRSRLAELESRKTPTFNPEDFRDQFLNIAREGIDIPSAPVIDRDDLIRDITGRIKQPRPFDPTRLRERLAALESREPAPVAPAFDPSGLQARIDALEGREPVAAPPAFDTSAIDQRFEDITRQLAELQSAQEQPSPAPVVPPVQQLPIQAPGDLDLGIKEGAPDIQDFAKPLPGGGTIFDRLEDPAVGNMQMGEGVPFTPPNQRPVPPISIGGPGGGRDDLVFAGGSPTFNERGEAPVPVAAPSPVVEPTPTPTPDPVATPTGEPAAPPPAPTIPTPPGSVDPVIMGQTADEVVTDPLIRALYFGTPDQPGFFNQLQQVGANLLGAQPPGTEYDPSMTEKFFNPFEDQVVQQTVEDVLKAGEQRDIAQRAQDIGRGGLSAFGSRARLTADERQEALGRGLGKALAGIRQSGFSEAQRTGLSEFDRQYGRDISQLYRPLDILRGVGGLLPGYTPATSRIGTTYGMPQDPSALGLGAALSAYSSFAPQTGAAYNAYANTTGQG
tara:strand:- start:2248 stop:4218 length:1971 start_codon:yes stop_codon:yes gene_type:complete